MWTYGCVGSLVLLLTAQSSWIVYGAVTTDDVVKNFLEGVQKNMVNGFPELGIPPLDPLYIPKYRMDTLQLDSVIIENLSAFRITKLESNVKEKSLDLQVTWDKDIKTTGRQYSVDGTLFNSIPIKGKGAFSIIARRFGISLHLKMDVSEGKTQLKDLQIQFSADDMQFDIENLYPGTDIGPRVNSMLKERFILIVNSKSALISKMIMDVVNPLLDQIPDSSFANFLPSDAAVTPDFLIDNSTLDILFARLRYKFAEDGPMVINLPKDDDLFTVDLFNATMNGTVSVYGGKIKGLESIHRTGDTQFHLKPIQSAFELSTTIGLNDLTASYYGSVLLQGLGSDIGLELTITHLELHAKVLVDADIIHQKIEKVEILELGFPDIGSLLSHIKLTGILDFAIDPLLDSVLNLVVGEQVLEPLADIIKDLINKMLEDMDFSFLP